MLREEITEQLHPGIQCGVNWFMLKYYIQSRLILTVVTLEIPPGQDVLNVTLTDGSSGLLIFRWSFDKTMFESDIKLRPTVGSGAEGGESSPCWIPTEGGADVKRSGLVWGTFQVFLWSLLHTGQRLKKALLDAGRFWDLWTLSVVRQ